MRIPLDQALIAEGVGLLTAVLPRRAIGEYQLQAAIATVHDEAATADQTDWPQILALYGLGNRGCVVVECAYVLPAGSATLEQGLACGQLRRLR